MFRLTAVLVFKPGGYLGEMSDFGYYRLLLSFTNQGYYPLIDFWVEYPPVFPWLMVGLYRLSLLIPAWTQAGTWFYLLLSGFLTLVEAGNLILIYALARQTVQSRAGGAPGVDLYGALDPGVGAVRRVRQPGALFPAPGRIADAGPASAGHRRGGRAGFHDQADAHRGHPRRLAAHEGVAARVKLGAGNAADHAVGRPALPGHRASLPLPVAQEPRDPLHLGDGLGADRWLLLLRRGRWRRPL